jgi:Ca2+-binding RTX toxin-like protein
MGIRRWVMTSRSIFLSRAGLVVSVGIPACADPNVDQSDAQNAVELILEATVEMSPPLPQPMDPTISLHGTVDFHTVFESIDQVCFRFSFDSADPLDPGDHLTIAYDEFDGMGFENGGTSPVTQRMICTPAGRPENVPFLDGSEDITVYMENGSVLLTAFTMSVSGTEAQSDPTCSFSSGTLTVTLNGTNATLARTVPGQIKLNGAPCPGATTSTTDFIQVNGTSSDDQVTIVGHSSFYPGLSRESVGWSEIEIAFSLGAGVDTVRLYGYEVAETIVLTAGGLDVRNDGDEDVTTAGVERVKIYGLGGSDFLMASRYAGGGRLYFDGGDGEDIAAGSPQSDWFFGEAGDDALNGGGGADRVFGGPGDDRCWGGDGNDIFYADATVDGDDDFYGGDGIDTVSYSRRTAGVIVTLGNHRADDGEPGVEADFSDARVERAIGGRGDDLLVGSGAANVLTGNAGDDELRGGAGGDTMHGGAGQDALFGDAGDDWLYGGNGNDTLDGGAGTDMFFGQDGDDIFINDDGVAETVDCGDGVYDDPEPSATDTFVACELI